MQIKKKTAKFALNPVLSTLCVGEKLEQVTQSTLITTPNIRTVIVMSSLSQRTSFLLNLSMV